MNLAQYIYNTDNSSSSKKKCFLSGGILRQEALPSRRNWRNLSILNTAGEWVIGNVKKVLMEVR